MHIDNDNSSEKLSTATLKRAETLINSASKLGVFSTEEENEFAGLTNGDTIMFLLENKVGDLCIIFCYKHGYLGEIWRGLEKEPFFSIDYYNVKNIRTFLSNLKRYNFSSIKE